MHIHPGVDHAFFNDTRPEVYDARDVGRAFARTSTCSARRSDAGLSRQRVRPMGVGRQ